MGPGTWTREAWGVLTDDELDRTEGRSTTGRAHQGAIGRDGERGREEARDIFDKI